MSNDERLKRAVRKARACRAAAEVETRDDTSVRDNSSLANEPVVASASDVAPYDGQQSQPVSTLESPGIVHGCNSTPRIAATRVGAESNPVMAFFHSMQLPNTPGWYVGVLAIGMGAGLLYAMLDGRLPTLSRASVVADTTALSEALHSDENSRPGAPDAAIESQTAQQDRTLSTGNASSPFRAVQGASVLSSQSVQNIGVTTTASADSESQTYQKSLNEALSSGQSSTEWKRLLDSMRDWLKTDTRVASQWIADTALPAATNNGSSQLIVDIINVWMVQDAVLAQQAIRQLPDNSDKTMLMTRYALRLKHLQSPEAALEWANKIDPPAIRNQVLSALR